MVDERLGAQGQHQIVVVGYSGHGQVGVRHRVRVLNEDCHGSISCGLLPLLPLPFLHAVADAGLVEDVGGVVGVVVQLAAELLGGGAHPPRVTGAPQAPATVLKVKCSYE